MTPAKPDADAKPRPPKKRKTARKSRPKSRTAVVVASPVPSPDAGVSRGAANPGLNGGTLIPGAGRGPQPGTGGRPKSILREKLHDIFQSRTEIIEAIADGEAIHRTRIRVTDILPFLILECPNCGTEGKELKEKLVISMANPIDDLYRTIEGTVSASPKERLQALDLAGKYGPGVVKQVGVEVVREKVVETLDFLRENLTEADFERLRPGLKSIWVVKAA